MYWNEETTKITQDLARKDRENQNIDCGRQTKKRQADLENTGKHAGGQVCARDCCDSNAASWVGRSERWTLTRFYGSVKNLYNTVNNIDVSSTEV
jgi:hypothetical protein